MSDDSHILMDKREEYSRINQEIEQKNRIQFEKEQADSDGRRADLHEISQRHERYLELREKYLKSRK